MKTFGFSIFVLLSLSILAPGIFNGAILAQGAVGCANNLLQNPGFESDFQNWEGTGYSLVAAPDVAFGAKAVKICAGGSGIRQTLPAVAGKTYVLQAKIKNAGFHNQAQLYLKFLSSVWQPLDAANTFSNFSTYTTDQIARVAPAGTAWIEVGALVGVGTPTHCLFVDDFCLTDGTGGGGGGGGGVDLELTATAPNANPAQWSFFSVNFNLKNAGTAPASGIKVKLNPNASGGIVYRGGQEFVASQGSYSTIVHEWTVGNLAAGATATLTVNYFNMTSTAKTVFGQVSAQNEPDADSQANNNNGTTPAQDDEAAANINGAPPAPKPDLQLANYNQNVNAVVAGNVLQYTFDLKNTGTVAASGNFNVKAWFSTDNVLSADDRQNGIVPTGNLAAGQTVANVAGASTVPLDLSPGLYYLILKADADNQMDESNENNNILVSQARFEVTAPASACPGNLALNGNFENGATGFQGSTFTVENNAQLAHGGAKYARVCFGNGGPGSNNDMWQSFATQPGKAYLIKFFGKTGDAFGLFFVRIPNFGQWEPVFVVSSDWREYQYYWVAPPGVSSANLVFSPGSTSLGASCFLVDDICLTEINLPPNTPDLTIWAPDGPMAVQAGAQQTYNLNISNSNAPVNGTYKVEAFYSTDGKYDLLDTPIGSLTRSNTPVGNQIVNLPVQIPAGAPTGPAFIFFLVDRELAVLETDKFNNQTYQSINVSTGGGGPKPDLELRLAAIPQSPGQWKNTVLTLTLKNDGTVAATGVTVDFPAQSDNTFWSKLGYQSHTAAAGTSFNLWTGLWTVGNLAPGESKTLTYNGFTKTAGQIPVFAQVKTASPADADSSPGNNVSGNPAEDDEAKTVINVNLLLASGDREIGNSKLEMDDLPDFQVFPNPSSGEEVFVKMPESAGDVRLTLLNNLGLTMYPGFAKSGQDNGLVRFDLRDVPSGQYLLKIEVAGQRAIFKKVIVSKL